MRLVGDWAKASAIASTMADKFKAAVRKALLRQGQFLRAEIVKGITSGAPAGKAFAPLSAMTLIVRRFTGRGGGTKPLIASGAMRASIQVHQVAGGGVFVGILRSARAKSGSKLANVGEIHEFGATWTKVMTDKQRRFLFAALRSAGAANPPKVTHTMVSSTKGGGEKSITFRIPARPFMGPIFEKYAKPDAVRKRFWQDVAEGMGYDLGRP